MRLAEVVLLSAALSIDALSIGASCGFGGVKISLSAKTIIILVSVFITAAAVMFGRILSGIVTELAGKVIGSVLLAALGSYMMLGAFDIKIRKKASKERKQGLFAASARILGDPGGCDIDRSMTIEPKEAGIIGIALSADSFSAGISAGISGGKAIFVPLVCGIFQLVFLYLGEKAASFIRRVSGMSERIFTLGAGIILIAAAMLRIII